MKQSISIILALAALSACAGAPDDQQDDNEVGTVRQGVTVRYSSNFAHGASTAASRLACTSTNLTQSCMVPLKKLGIKWCIDSASLGFLTASQKADIQNGFNAIGTAGTGSSFQHQTDGVACDNAINARTVDIGINAANSGLCSGTATSSSIDAYVCNNIPTGPQLTEPTSLPGNFFPILSTGDVVLFHIDLADIATKCNGDVFACDALLKHGIAHSAENTLGTGARTDITNAWSSRAILPFNDNRIITTGEKCRLIAYNPMGTTTVVRDTTGTCPD